MHNLAKPKSVSYIELGPQWPLALYELALLIKKKKATCIQHHPKALCTNVHMAFHSRRLYNNMCQHPPAADFVQPNVAEWIADYDAQWVWSLKESPPPPNLKNVASLDTQVHGTCPHPRKALR